MRRRVLIIAIVIAALVAGVALAADADTLGPGSRLARVEVKITADGVALPPIVEDWVLPAGRNSLGPNGANVYAATLPARHFAHKGMSFDFVPTITVTTNAAGDQSLDLAATFNSRQFDKATTPTEKTRFEVTVGWTSGNGVVKSVTDGIFTSCMHGDTLITLNDGQRVAIRDLAPGEYVGDPVTGAGLRIRTVIRGPEPIPLVEIAWAGGAVRFSERHPVPTPDGLVAAVAVPPGTWVRDAHGWQRVERVTRVGPEDNQLVYNLALEPESPRAEDHVFIAGGLVVGDAWLQDELAAGRAPEIPWSSPPVGAASALPDRLDAD